MKITTQRASILFRKALSRTMQEHGPEADLCAAVIGQAFSDSLQDVTEAQKFFSDGRADFWCEAIGVHPETVRDMVVRARRSITSPPQRAKRAAHRAGSRIT